MIRKSCLRSLIRAALGLFIASSVLSSSVRAFANPTYPSFPPDEYTEYVVITEDTFKRLSNATTTYNGVNYGKEYNPLYYFLNYADLREAFGADPNKLIEHYVTIGKKPPENRVADRLLVRYGETNSGNTEYVVPSAQKTKTKKDEMVVISGEVHSNGGMTRTQENEARNIARQLAASVFNQVMNNGDGSQIQMLAYATGMVKAYCDRGTYTTEGKIYRTAYGVFIGNEYSCAGATRALGLVIDYINDYCQYYNSQVGEKVFSPMIWVHVNANTWNNQYCQVICDNHEAYADAVAAWAGYGKHPDEGGKKQDVQSYVGIADETSVFTTVEPKVDGGRPIQSDPQYNKKN